jgi:hypothetical protein
LVFFVLEAKKKDRRDWNNRRALGLAIEMMRMEGEVVRERKQQ